MHGYIGKIRAVGLGVELSVKSLLEEQFYIIQVCYGAYKPGKQ